jgi:hypothetical protein
MRSEGKVILIYYKDQATAYARIESIGPDIKKGWYQVTLLLLTIPAQTVTWILRESYVDGAPFTMGGIPVRLEEVKRTSLPGDTEISDQSKEKEAPGKPGKVIPFKKS